MSVVIKAGLVGYAEYELVPSEVRGIWEDYWHPRAHLGLACTSSSWKQARTWHY